MEMIKIIDLDQQFVSPRKTGEEVIAAALLLGLNVDFLGGSSRFVKVRGEAGSIDDLDHYITTYQYDPRQEPVDDDMI